MTDNFIILLVFLFGVIPTFLFTKNYFKKSKNKIPNENIDKLKEELISLKTKFSEKEEQIN